MLASIFSIAWSMVKLAALGIGFDPLP